MDNHFEISYRLIICVLLGGAIGIERERRNQVAGLRTHIILCVGSGLMMMISIYMSELYKERGIIVDPTRIAAQVVSGIGFLGAGAILRQGVSIKGLTTATSLWTTGGIGLSVGSGYYFAASVSVIIILITLSFLSKIEKIFLKGKREMSLNIKAEDNKGVISKIEEIMEKHNMSLRNLQVERNSVSRIMEITAIISIPPKMNITTFVHEMTLLAEISEIEVV